MLRYETPKGDEELRELAELFAEEKVWPGVVSHLDATFALPRDLTIRFESCGEANAAYDDEADEIVMCWELIREFAENFAAEYEDDEDMAAGLVGATMFTFFHELGHALIHELDLPITGKEENVVDQLATLILVADGGDEGVELAIDGALAFMHEAEAAEGEEEAFWDTHATGERRFYNTLCWVYGSDPKGLGDLLESNDGPLPDDRADFCQDEWERMSKAWERLLKPHLRGG